MLKILWIVIGVAGVWFVASAATENGLLPSGHAVGRIPEAIIGVFLIAYAAFRVYRSQTTRTDTE